jgi:hypothetical protein
MGDDILGEIEALRADIGGCISTSHVLASHVGRGIGGREVSLAITKLQEAAMWLRQASELWQDNMSETSDQSRNI